MRRNGSDRVAVVENPERSMCAEILAAAVREYAGDAAVQAPEATKVAGVPKAIPMELNDCTGHFIYCRCPSCARDFLFGHVDDDPVPMNFRFCCLVLDLDPDAVFERLRRMRRSA